MHMTGVSEGRGSGLGSRISGPLGVLWAGAAVCVVGVGKDLAAVPGERWDVQISSQPSAFLLSLLHRGLWGEMYKAACPSHLPARGRGSAPGARS